MYPDNKRTTKKITAPDNDIHYPSQKNHDACFIPQCVRQYRGEPLYILVAYWCMKQKTWVQRNQISEAFHITARRASYLVSYLRTKATRVVCEWRATEFINNVRRFEIRVTHVTDCSPPCRRHRSRKTPVLRRRVGNADTAQANRLWNQLTRNHAGKLQNNEGDDDD
ncbi:CaiF/GrlA family transcriptional regulator [Salmonella enterica]|nr:CaiF/GrlA family transcriptional regulator [Salmonella enterica subsp. enterica serovar Minnesota]EGG8414402.1 CaiF/GrlA family transcriptional regulator [Salmonella enterica]